MSNISNITQKYEHQTLMNEPVDKTRTDPKGGQPTGNTAEMPRDDKVSLSQASKEMMLVKKAVNESPDIREEKVAQLKAAIANNEYHVDSGKIAESFIGTLVSEVV